LNEKIIEQAVSTTKEKWNTDSQLTSDRTEVLEKFGEIFKLKNIDNLTADQLQEFLRFKNNRHWKNIERPGGNLIKNMTKLKNGLKILLDESRPLPERIRDIREENSENLTPHLGMSIYSPILFVAYPEKYPVINEPVAQALHELGLYDIKKWKNDDEWVTIPKMQEIVHSYAKKYEFDLWQIDWVWWEISKEQNQSTQWWIISAGQDAKRDNVWNEFRNSNTVGFYWNETGDLSKLTEEQIKEKFKQLGIKKRGKKYDWGSARDILKIKKNDILFIKNGKRGFYGIGKATDTYQYNTNQSYHHSIPVQWITTQPYDTPDKIHLNLQLNNTLARIPDKNQEPRIVKYYENAINGNFENFEYFLLRHSLKKKQKTTAWIDQIGKEYHVGRQSDGAMGHNVQKLLDAKVGSKAVWISDSIKNSTYVLGYGTIKSIGNRIEGESWNVFFENFIKFEDSKTSKIKGKKMSDSFLNEIKLQLKESKGNWQHSVNKIPKKLYQQMIGEDLTSEDDEIDSVTMDNYDRALEWKPNLILYGPPGTGKTFHANQIAKKITRDQVPKIGICWATSGDLSHIETENKINDFAKNIKKNGKVLWGVDWAGIKQVNPTDYPITGYIYHKWNIIAKAKISNCTSHEDTDDLDLKLRQEKWHEGNDNKWYLHLIDIQNCEPFSPKNLTLFDDSKKIQDVIQQRVYVKQKTNFIRKVTFHPSYSYEDFVEGYRPNIAGTDKNPYKLEDGIFKQICNDAKDDDPENKHVIIIDEINRGNIPKILGELITLIEKDKRKQEYSLKLTYSKDDFFVPKNLIIIGTMNTADKSLMQMDDALKRRFVFEELMPDNDLLEKELKKNNVPNAEDYSKILRRINEKITGNGKNPEAMIQFRDRQIGHSYFWKLQNDDDLQKVIKYDIIPLLQDYFYGDYSKIREILSKEKDNEFSIIGKDNRTTDLVNDVSQSSKLREKLLEILQ